MDKLLTPDAPLGEVSYKTVLLTVPEIPDIEAAVWGGLYGVSFLSSWQERGTMTQREASLYIKAVIDSRRDFSMIGTVQAVIRDTLDPSMLLCDGSVYNKEDYPQLWEALPLAMKDATTLTVPDLQNLFLVGAGLDYSLADTGGLAEVSLTVEEIPSHSHGYLTPTFNVDIESVGVPDPTGVGLPQVPAVTDSTGGGQAHENRPPYYAVRYAIIAR